jgi:hypothetical protein
MPSSFRDITEYRLRQHADALAAAVKTTDSLVVPAAAADLVAALYDLTRYWRDQDTARYDELCRSSDDGKTVGGLTHLRGQATHHAVVTSAFTDAYAERYYDHYGCWTWYADAAVTRDEIAEMYRDHVAGKDAAATLPAVTRFSLHTLSEALSSPA